VYDELYVADIITALEAGQDNYDLLICADVFPYIGNVGPLFAAVSSHSRRDALFAFSTELDTGEKFILRASGRYAHSQSYLRSMSEKFGFTVITMRTENLRKQRGEWITGDLVIIQYR
jgi:predicted TPR repeat methyltransferase